MSHRMETYECYFYVLGVYGVPNGSLIVYGKLAMKH